MATDKIKPVYRWRPEPIIAGDRRWPRAQWQYFSFQGGIDAQVRDEIEGGRLVARFSNQVRYGRKGRGNGQT